MSHVDVHAVVIEQSAKWQHFYAIGDFESLSHLYTPDCKVFAPGSLLSEGRIGKLVYTQCNK